MTVTLCRGSTLVDVTGDEPTIARLWWAWWACGWGAC